MLVGHQSKTSRAVTEGGHKDRHIQLVSGQDDAVDPTLRRCLALLLQISAHLPDKLTRTVGPGIQRICNDLAGLVAKAQFLFIDERVVDAIDHQFAQGGVFRSLAVKVVGDPVPVSQRLEEVLVDHVGPGRNHGIDHVVAHQVDKNLFQSGADQRSGEAENHSAILVAQHALVDGSRPGKVTGAVGHGLHGIHQRHDIVLLDVDVLDGRDQEFFFRRHSNFKDSKANSCRDC